MNDIEIQKFGEIQYLKGRIDELNKALPTVTNLHRQRVLDARLSKYHKKLKKVDEIAYHLFQVESVNIRYSKQKSKKEIKELLLEVKEKITDTHLLEKLSNQISKYDE